MEGSRNPKEIRGYCEQSCSTTLEAGSQLIRMKEGSVATLETGAAANLVCFRRLTHHNSPMGKVGLPRVETYPAKARLKFGGGRIGDARFAADITAAIAGARRNFTALVLDVGAPA